MSMVKIYNQEQIETLNSLYRQYPKCRFLVKLDSIESTEGRLIAVSDSIDTDGDIARIMHENMNQGNLCMICGDYVHGNNNVVGSIR